MRGSDSVRDLADLEHDYNTQQDLMARCYADNERLRRKVSALKGLLFETQMRLLDVAKLNDELRFRFSN